MRKLFSILILSVLATLALGACAHPSAKPIRLPTAAAVRAPIQAAKASASRAAAILARSAKTGLVAGSDEYAQVTTATCDTVQQLTEASARVDQLTTDLALSQKEVSKQTETVTWYEKKYNEAVKSLWWYRLRFWGPLTLAVVAVGLILAAKFTAWGGRVVGPFLVKAAAVGAAFA